LPPGFRVLWLTVVIDAVGFGIVVPILGLYAEEFGASPTTVGLLVASFSVAQLVAAPLLGRISDRRGRRPLIIASLFGTAVGSLLTGLAGSLPLLFLGRIVDGASGASVTVARASAADIAEPDDRPRLFGLLGAALGLGFIIGPAVGSLAALGDERLPFYLAAAIATINGVVAWFRLPETRAAPEADGRTPAASDHRDPAGIPLVAADGAVRDPARTRAAFYRLLVVSFAAMAAFAAFETSFPLLLEARFDVGLGEVGLLFAGVGVVVVGVRAVMIEPVVDLLGESGALRAGLVANATGLALIAVDAGWPLVLTGLLVLIVGQGVLLPVLTSSVAALSVEGASGGILGWQQSAQSLARIAGPIAAGVLFEVATGWPFVVGAAVSVVALAIVPSGVGKLGRFGTAGGKGVAFITRG
jgi:multidrug resistance protein